MSNEELLQSISEILDQRFNEQDARIEQRFAEQDAWIKQSFAKQQAYIDHKLEEQQVYIDHKLEEQQTYICLLYTSPSPRDRTRSRMPSSA